MSDVDEEEKNEVAAKPETPKEPIGDEDPEKKKLRLTAESAKILGINLPDQKGNEASEKRVEIPRDPVQQPETPVQSDLFVSKVRWKRDLKVTKADKEAYLRTMLHKEPFELDIKFFGDQLVLHFKARTSFEQSICIEAMDLIAKARGNINILTANTELQNLSLAIMLKQINGKDTGAVDLPVDMSREDAAKLLYEQLPRIEAIQETPLEVYIQAMMMFHEKQAIMQEECLNADFWKPAD